jgi:hypothetical protein
MSPWLSSTTLSPTWNRLIAGTIGSAPIGGKTAQTLE